MIFNKEILDRYPPDGDFRERVAAHETFVNDLIRTFKVPYNIHRKWRVGKRKKNIRRKTIHYLKK